MSRRARRSPPSRSTSLRAGRRPPQADEEAVALVTAPEGSHLEVVPGGERRRMRERVRLATGLAIGAAVLAVLAVHRGARR